MNKRMIIPLVLLLIPAAPWWGGSEAAPGLDPSGFSLYDNTGGKWFVPTVSHRVYLGYTTGSRGSWSTGAYVGTMTFDLTSRLSAEVSLGVAEHLFFTRGFDRREYTGDLLLDWRPFDSLRLQLGVGGVLPEEALGGAR